MRFSFEAVRGEALTDASVRGRLTVIAFLTTYDVASQAQARFLTALVKTHTPRINGAIVVLESEDNRLLIEAFVDALGIDYPVALADADTIAGRGPFEGLHHVPSVVVLDKKGRERLRRLGLTPEEELVEMLRSIE